MGFSAVDWRSCCSIRLRKKSNRATAEALREARARAKRERDSAKPQLTRAASRNERPFLLRINEIRAVIATPSLLGHFAVKAVAVDVTDLFKLAGCRILDPEANARFATLVFVDLNHGSWRALEETAGADHNALRGCKAAA